MQAIIQWVQQNWVQLGIALWGLEKVLEAVVVLTPWKGDDNLGVILAKLLKNIWPKA